MKSRLFCTVGFAAVLTLLLAVGLTISAGGANGRRPNRAAASRVGVTEYPPLDRLPTSVGDASWITFTPGTTLHLPIVFNHWDPCSAAPTLISPSNGLSLPTIAPEFRWDSGDNPRATLFRLRVSQDPEFERWDRGLASWSAQGEGAFRFHENFEPDTTYYWRARLLCGELEGPYSEIWSFRTGVEGDLPPTPTLTTPLSGTATSSPSVTLRWLHIYFAREYLVRYREVGVDAYGWVWTEDLQLALTLDGDTTYEWWVAARNDYGIGPDSEMWRFTTPAAPGAVPQGAEHRSTGRDSDRIIIERP